MNASSDLKKLSSSLQAELVTASKLAFEAGDALSTRLEAIRDLCVEGTAQYPEFDPKFLGFSVDRTRNESLQYLKLQLGSMNASGFVDANAVSAGVLRYGVISDEAKVAVLQKSTVIERPFSEEELDGLCVQIVRALFLVR